jgi:exopolysaccharide production protein ExoF
MFFSRVHLPKVVLIVLALGCRTAIANENADQDSSLAASSERAVAVTDAQRLALKFSEIPRLNGEYRINADETLTIPGMGRVTVTGITARQLEEILAAKATGILGRDVYVAVEVAEYRPVFITGQVGRSGPTPWQPGLTVEQAIAAAGGITQLQSEDSTVQRRKAQDDRKRLMAALARLRAEQQGAEQIEMPKQLSSLGQAEAESLMEAQSALMFSRRRAIQKQLEALALGKALANQELDSLRLQKTRLDDQLRLRRKQSEKIQALLERNLTVVDRALEENIKVSDLEEKSANISVAVARVQATITNFDRDALNISETRKSEIDAEVVRLEREIAQTGAELNLDSENVDSGFARIGREKALPVRFSISRRTRDESKIIEGDRYTSLIPGDVVTVTQSPALK